MHNNEEVISPWSLITLRRLALPTFHLTPYYHGT